MIFIRLTNTRMYNVQSSFWKAENNFLLRESSVFAIISYSDLSSASLLLVYFGNSQTKRL